MRPCQVIRPTFLLRSSRVFFYGVRLSALHPTPNLKNHVSLFISALSMVVQWYSQALGSSGTSGLLIPVPIYVGPWGKGRDIPEQLNGFFLNFPHRTFLHSINSFNSNQTHIICRIHIFITCYLLSTSVIVTPSSGGDNCVICSTTVCFWQSCYIGYAIRFKVYTVFNLQCFSQCLNIVTNFFFNCCLSVHVDNYTIIVPTKCTSFY
jgi:hypothetical protein